MRKVTIQLTFVTFILGFEGSSQQIVNASERTSSSTTKIHCTANFTATRNRDGGYVSSRELSFVLTFDAHRVVDSQGSGGLTDLYHYSSNRVDELTIFLEGKEEYSNFVEHNHLKVDRASGSLEYLQKEIFKDDSLGGTTTKGSGYCTAFNQAF